MRNLILEELRRLYKVVLFISILSLLLIVSYSYFNDNHITILKDYKIARYCILFVFLIITIRFCLDNIRPVKFLYQKSSFKKSEIIYSRLCVTLILTLITTVILLTYLNIRVYLLMKNNYLEFLKLNIDDCGLIFINKGFMEWLYVINFFINLSFYFFVIYLVFWYYKSLQIKKREKYVDMFISLVVVLIPTYLLLILSRLLTNSLDFLNFNKLSTRIRAFVTVGYEANFLSVVTIILYFIAFSLIKSLLIKEVKE